MGPTRGEQKDDSGESAFANERLRCMRGQDVHFLSWYDDVISDRNFHHNRTHNRWAPEHDDACTRGVHGLARLQGPSKRIVSLGVPRKSLA